MTITLKMTEEEVKSLMNDEFEDRFEILFDDIPFYHSEYVRDVGETHRPYTEDDGRERRWFIFKDKTTDIEYTMNYTYNPDWPNDIDDLPDNMELVTKEEDSSLYQKPEAIVTQEPILSAEEKADKEMWSIYQSNEKEYKKVERKEKLNVPKEVIKDIINFLKTQKFSYLELRAKIIPVCIEYKLEQESFWTWLQIKRGVWKA